MKVVTFAYVNVYQYGTVELARNVIRSKDEYAQTEALKRWCLSKGRESSYVQIAVRGFVSLEMCVIRLSLHVQAAILVAAASASLSTNAATESHWSCPAFWYSSIVLAIAAIFTGAQQALVLPDPDKPGTLDHVDTKTLEKIRRSFATPSAPQEVSELAMFAWQIPIMLLSYSVFAYLIGLCSGVISPLAHNFHWGNEAKVSACSSWTHSGLSLIRRRL